MSKNSESWQKLHKRKCEFYVSIELKRHEKLIIDKGAL